MRKKLKPKIITKIILTKYIAKLNLGFIFWENKKVIIAIIMENISSNI